MIKLLWRIIWGDSGPVKPLCAHDWETVAKTTNPPWTDLSDLPVDYEDMPWAYQERLLKGLTSILRSCRKCGFQDVFELLGAPIQ